MVILLVEDDQVARKATCEILEHLGHRVESASSAEQALSLIKNLRFDVLLADINLPRMSGIDFADIVIQSFPDIRIIFVSGSGYLLADKTKFPFYLLPKPFRATQLTAALESVCSI